MGISSPRRIARRSRHLWGSYSQWGRRLAFIVGALAVGMACVGFAMAAEWANQLFHRLYITQPWLSWIVVPGGFAILCWVQQRYFRGAQGSGIPQVIAALKDSSGTLESLLTMRVAMGKVALTTGALMCGAVVGREGPSVQVGAALMLALSVTGLFPQAAMRRGLILAGGAAGIAAAFNAPLAGVVFAIEEMHRAFAPRTTGIVIMAVVVAGVVAVGVQGNYVYFGHTEATLGFVKAGAALAAVAIACALTGGLFSATIQAASERLPGPLERLRANSPALFAAACGLALAALGYATAGRIFGTGYEETRHMLSAGGSTTAFGFEKLAALTLTSVSGLAGGIFAPSLSVGAGIGAFFAPLFPQSPAQALMVVGMAAYLSAVVQAPLTSLVIVSEMTGDTDMALPLMATTLVAAGISRLLCPTPLYKGLAHGFLARKSSAQQAIPSGA